MQTFDSWRSCSTDELTLVATGTATAPVVIDRDSGHSVTMHPAWAHPELAWFGIGSVADTPNSPGGNAWWGDLPILPEQTEARLAIVTDGIVRLATVRWPEPPKTEPEPVSNPRRRTRLRRVK